MKGKINILEQLDKKKFLKKKKIGCRIRHG